MKPCYATPTITYKLLYTHNNIGLLKNIESLSYTTDEGELAVRSVNKMMAMMMMNGRRLEMRDVNTNLNMHGHAGHSKMFQ